VNEFGREGLSEVAASNVRLFSGRVGNPSRSRNLAAQWNIPDAHCVNVTMEHPAVVRVLAISGSLRSKSSNSAVVNAATKLAPTGVEVSVYRGLADIPPFNPDLDTDDPPAAVLELRAALGAADAILISSPEYAHGVSGVLKNALDWVVGSGELIDKPIALINASWRAIHAHASLQETLITMSGRVIADASITIALDRRALDANDIAADVDLSTLLTSALDALARSTRTARTG
jgi:chromate reductase, NAD(P)H dehydrogenase (quinone)